MAVQSGKFCANCGSEVFAETCQYCGHMYKRKNCFLTQIWAPIKDRSWFKNPFWVAVIGSFIIIIGQIFATYLAIYTSSEASDFSISVDKTYFDFYKNKNDKIFYQRDFFENSPLLNHYTGTMIGEITNIKISDAHQVLKPYPYHVFIKAPDELPKGVRIEIENPDGIPPFEISMYVAVTNETKVGNYPIAIQAIGGDGRTRSCQCYIRVNSYEEMVLKYWMGEYLKKKSI